MVDVTDRHCRYFLRLISRRTLLYTEMVTTGALLHGAACRWLEFHPAEHPVALQLGGSDPAALATCARMAAAAGYDEINLNVGCPSPRVQTGRFGACLMAEPALVADCVAAMRAACTLPVTVKTRIGIDDQDRYEQLCEFIAIVAQAGCRRYIVHARKAWLKGLNPAQNRDIPPLDYPRVYRLKEDFPALEFILNGGIRTLAQAQVELPRVDGIMCGRAVYQNPYLLAQVDAVFFQEAEPPRSRMEVLHAYADYIAAQQRRGVPPKSMARHVLGLFQGLPGARMFRRILSTAAPGEYSAGVLLRAAREAGLCGHPE